MEKVGCEVCAFRNPRATVTALILKDKKVLLAKRTQEPFLGWWDLIGGYMSEQEVPEDALRREIKEELSIDCGKMELVGFFPGYAEWKGVSNPILSIVYRTDLSDQKINLSDEILELKWFSREDLPPVAFDSNNKIIEHAKNRGLI
ncbi:MAG: NUDIX domain-containing protein [bacterium]|nr:NUDIX domain-containing protein [bacterium]